jgi:WD40 repeat protein
LRIVTGSTDMTARLWDAQTGLPLGQAMKHDGNVIAAAFSADGLRIVTGSTDMTARLWDAQTGLPLGQPMRHDGGVTGAAFSADGTRVVTCSRDNTARLWDGQTGAPLGEPMKHEAQVLSVAFTPEGAQVRTLSDEGTVRLWDLPLPRPEDPDWIWLSVEVRTWRTIENGVPRTLAPTEWLQRRKELDALGGDCLNRTWDDLTEKERLGLRTPLRGR